MPRLVFYMETWEKALFLLSRISMPRTCPVPAQHLLLPSTRPAPALRLTFMGCGSGNKQQAATASIRVAVACAPQAASNSCTGNSNTRTCRVLIGSSMKWAIAAAAATAATPQQLTLHAPQCTVQGSKLLQDAKRSINRDLKILSQLPAGAAEEGRDGEEREEEEQEEEGATAGGRRMSRRRRRRTRPRRSGRRRCSSGRRSGAAQNDNAAHNGAVQAGVPLAGMLLLCRADVHDRE
jgi:hypothetical protein